MKINIVRIAIVSILLFLAIFITTGGNIGYWWVDDRYTFFDGDLAKIDLDKEAEGWSSQRLTVKEWLILKRYNLLGSRINRRTVKDWEKALKALEAYLEEEK